MRKIDKFIDELQELKKKGYDAKKVDALTEGVNLIAAEYRRRKAKEDAQKKAMVEAAGFAKLDEQYKASGLSKKAFIEGVGKTIIDSKHPDDIKNRMMDTLGKYVSLTESANTIATRWAEGTLDDNDKKMLADGNVEGFKKSVLERTQMAFRWAAQAKFDEVANLVTDKTAMYKGYSLARAIINTPDEKLLLLKSAHPTGNELPSFVYAAKVSQSKTLESVGMNLIESTYSKYIHDVAARHSLPEEAERELQEGFNAYCESAALNEGRIMDWIGKTGDKAFGWYADKVYRKPVRTILATMIALLGGATGIAVPAVKHDISCGHYWPASVSEEKVSSYGIDTEEGRNALIAKAETLIERLSTTNQEGKNGSDILKAMVKHIRNGGSENDYLDLVAMVECADGLLRSIETGTCANGDTYRDQGHVNLSTETGVVRNGVIPHLINMHNIHTITSRPGLH